MTGFWIFIVVLTIGLLVSFTGLLLKIRHWPSTQELINDRIGNIWYCNSVYYCRLYYSQKAI